MKRTPLRAVPPADRSAEPGYRAWHATVIGACAVCGKRGLLLRHHVVTEQVVRRERGDPWDLRNGILIGDGRRCSCHRAHHSALRRIPASKLTAESIEFAIELLGAGAADAYIDRCYSAS